VLVSCGCGKFQDDHGDKRNITLSAIEAAASAGGVSGDEVFQNISQASQQVKQQSAGP
jgi:hypothetical protein